MSLGSGTEILIRQDFPRRNLSRVGEFEGGKEATSDLGDLVELAKEFVEHKHQLLRGALTG